MDNRCSRSMTGVKSYLHKYVEQSGPKVVFGDNSSYITERYGSIKCGGIVFLKVAFVNGLKYNLICISQLCDAKYTIQFDDKQGTILNANKEIVLIAPRRNDVYVFDMSSLTLNGACFFAKASESVNFKKIRTDNESEFKNSELESFCDEKRISQNFSSPYTPKQNGVAERNNRTLIETARTMLNGSILSKHFWTEASIEAIRFINTSVDETAIDDSSRYPLDEFLHEANPSRQYQENSDISYYITSHNCSHTELTKDTHVPEVITQNEQNIPHTENVEGVEALKHLGWVDAMQEELNQFYRNKVWTLVPLPKGKIAISSKWVFRNQKDKLGNVTRNNARLVAQGYSQEERIGNDETFVLVARMEAISIFFAFATYINFKVF
ncbi:retrovirus-related pol polyprotein from transposon TNT 1-94 [Tanacetum coccineum]